MAAFEVFLQGRRGMQIDAVAARDSGHQQMLFLGNAALFVIDDLMIAIESKAVFHVAPDAENGNPFAGGSEVEQPVGQGPGGIGSVGSSRVDLQACKLEYSIVSPK